MGHIDWIPLAEKKPAGRRMLFYYPAVASPRPGGLGLAFHVSVDGPYYGKREATHWAELNLPA